MGKRKVADASPAAHAVDDADKADTSTKRARQAPDPDASTAKAAPVLQWMRVPMALQGSVALALQHVRGVDPRLTTALQQGAHYPMPCPHTTHTRCPQLAYRACTRCKPRYGT